MSMRVVRLQWLLLSLTLVTGACDRGPQEEAIPAGPLGYIQFYIPEDAPGMPGHGVDVAVYRLQGGERIFEGMTRRWKGLSEPKRGLLVTLAPGEYDFAVAVGEGEKTVSVRLDEGAFVPVRVWFSGASGNLAGGALNATRFRIHVRVEDGADPGGG